ncbi:MAG TPA: tolB protein [Polyangiaceae bacterium]|nr:tolB protein [Polyangiaceae bacterium]
MQVTSSTANSRSFARRWARQLGAALLASVAFAQTSLAQTSVAPPPVPEPPKDESVLGELLITGDTTEHVTPLAVLPSLSPDLEDVIVRGVVRRDFELTGMFAVIDDAKAPEGLYGFNDPVDIKAWSKLGAEVIIKVAAQKQGGDMVKIFGICYFLSHGKEPVYEKTLVVKTDQVRPTAHRITDALLGAITGRNGGFSSHLTFAAKSGKNPSIYTVDADGHNIRSLTPLDDTSVAPTWGPNGTLFYTVSRKYAPFKLVQYQGPSINLPFTTSIYSVAFSPDHKRLAVAVGTTLGSHLYVGNANGTNMQQVSNTEVATHPVFSPSGKLAWIGGGGEKVGQRVYVDGKAVSPPSFSAAAPTFCDTEDGIMLVYAVAVGKGQDLVMANETGGNVRRITQGEGSNSYPACSPDGRLIAFFSERKDPGLYIKSLKSGKAQQISKRLGESLRWAALPGSGQ